MDIDTQRAKRDLDTSGYVLFERLLGDEMLGRVRSRLVEQARRERTEGWAATYDACSQGVLNLLNKGEVFAELVEQPLVLALMEHLLGPGPLLSSITANIVGPGTKAQMLHGDQAIMPAPWPYCAVANVAWILDDFTETNGATVIVPGSHVHGTHPDYVNPPKTVPVIAPAGSAMVFDGRLWHGAGANVSSAPRHAIFAYYCRPFLRQQENMFLSLDRAVIERASPTLRSLLGYTPYLGKIGIIPRDARTRAREAHDVAQTGPAGAVAHHQVTGITSKPPSGRETADGTWNMTADSAMGKQPFTMSIKTNGATFTGSLFNAQGTQDIAGQVDGDTLMWTTEMTQPVRLTLEYRLTFQRDEVSGSVNAGAYGTTPIKGSRAPVILGGAS